MASCLAFLSCPTGILPGFAPLDKRDRLEAEEKRLDCGESALFMLLYFLQ